MLADSALRGAGRRTSRSSCCTCATCRRRRPTASSIRTGTTSCAQSLQRESELFFESIIREDRSILDLLTADYTFVNERLARHYGIPNVYGARFRRVTLPPEMDYRRGLLGKGSFLAVTWTQNFRSSPVKRGVWVLENILGHAAAGAAAERPSARGDQERRRQGADAARADDAAPREPAVRRLPQHHGPDRVRARELRRRRELAHQAGRRRRHADRREGEAVRRPGRRRPGRIADGAAALLAAVRRGCSSRS